MTYNKKNLFSVLLAIMLLTGCVGHASKNSNIDSKTVAVESPVEKSGILFNGIIISSTNNECIDHLNLLKKIEPVKYQKYIKDYVMIMDDIKYWNVNKNIMDSDSKNLLAMALNTKLDLLCARVKYNNFVSTKKKIQKLVDSYQK